MSEAAAVGGLVILGAARRADSASVSALPSAGDAFGQPSQKHPYLLHAMGDAYGPYPLEFLREKLATGCFPNDERRDRGDDVGKPAPVLSRVATARRTAKSYPWMEPSGPTRGLGSVSLCVPGATATMGKAMPRVRSADQQSPAHSPTCPACGKAMRLVMAAPATPYTNLKHATFECDCGETGHALVADKD